MSVIVVAEIGINHNGSLDNALRLIDAARLAGADAVKFQKRAVEFIPDHMKSVPRETPWGTMTYLDYKRRIEFGPAEYDLIDEYCRRLGIVWTASVWDIPSLVFLKERYALPWWKIPSAKLTDDELLAATARPDRPVVLSTGMSTMDQIRHAVSIIEHEGASLTILHCNSTYPCPVEGLNLRCIETLRKEFIGIPIGYSGHEVGLATTVAAVALGAAMVERHITLERSMWGTDQAASVEPRGFARLVKDIRNVEQALGDGVKRVYESELEPMRRMRGA